MKQIPFSARWTIAEEDLVKLKDSEDDEYLESKYISTSCGQLKYYLQIYPNGDDEESRGEVIIYFGIKIDNFRKVKAKYTLKVESADFNEERKSIHEESTAWGEYFCETDELFDHEEKFIVDGKFVLTVDGIFKIVDEVFKEVLEWDVKLGGVLWAKNDSKDFLIIGSDGKGIKAHKIVLRARSPVFAAMLRSNMKEATENQLEMIDFSSDVIERALMLIYDYTDEFEASDKQARSILQFFDKYDFKSFKDQLEETFFDQIDVVSVCELMNCAIKSNALKLQEKCFQFLTTAFEEKTPIADLDILEKEVLLKIVQNSLYQNVETDK